MPDKHSEQKPKYFWAALLVFTLVASATVMELAAQTGVKARSLLGDFKSFREYYLHLQKFDPLVDAIQMLRYDIKRSPYFGYVSKSGNNYGFRTPYDLPLKREKNDFYIGLFGGSVAETFNQTGAPFIKILKERLPKLKNKDVKIVNFALGGYKQLQTYIIYSLFFDQLDMAIQLDGWNEVFVTAGSTYPPEFPNDAQFLFSDRDINFAVIDRYAAVRRFLTRWSSFIHQHPPLDQSAALFIMAQAAEQYLKEQSDILAKAGESEIESPAFAFSEERTDIWARYLKMQHVLSKSKKVPLYSFIQPNQYALPGKKLTANELSCCFKPKRRPVDPFNRLRKKAKEHFRTVSSHYDLNELFVGEARDLYVDDCCHLNTAGNQLMAEHMANLIAEHYRRSSKGLTYAKATK